jgi:S-disulfanyl-L-cysteine oxidoreductase SoxD
MSTYKPFVFLALLLAFGARAALAQAPGLGKPISEAEIKAWDIAILPDGTGLPPGSGTPAQGAPIYSQKCAMCHGDNGVNPKPGYGPMVGAHTFDKIDAAKTAGLFNALK